VSLAYAVIFLRFSVIVFVHIFRQAPFCFHFFSTNGILASRWQWRLRWQDDNSLANWVEGRLVF
jgi:hypothetical protein